jgi:hypothetical protein
MHGCKFVCAVCIMYRVCLSAIYVSVCACVCIRSVHACVCHLYTCLQVYAHVQECTKTHSRCSKGSKGVQSRQFVSTVCAYLRAQSCMLKQQLCALRCSNEHVRWRTDRDEPRTIRTETTTHLATENRQTDRQTDICYSHRSPHAHARTHT